MMSIIKRAKREPAANITRGGRRGSEPNGSRKGFDRYQVAIAGIFIAFTALVILVCFVGLSPIGATVGPDQISRVRITAEFGFGYESRILTEQRRDELRQRIPPVYRIAMEPYSEFESYLRELNTAFRNFAEDPILGESSGAIRFTRDEVRQVLAQYDPANTYFFSVEDLHLVVSELSLERQSEVFEEGLAILKSLYREGIVDEEDLQLGSGRLSFFNIQREGGHMSEVEALVREDALRTLRINLSALAIPRSVSIALFRILRNGLKPNLVYDTEETERAIARAIAAVPPVEVFVKQGDTIVEPGARLTPLRFEQLSVYRDKLAESRESEWAGFNPLLLEQSIFTILIILGAALYVRILKGTLHRHIRTLGFSALILLLNLGLIRLALEAAGDGIGGTASWTQALSLPWAAPVAFGPIIVSILVGGGSGVLAAALIGVFNALMQGGSIDILVVSFVAGVAGIHAVQGIQLRTRVVRAGLIAGIFMGVGAVILGLRDWLEWTTIGSQVGAALASGVVTGIIVIGLLPLLEQLFRYTTNITLLELTDFNHPLLRKLQIAAPGSYHHSLMVANLAENAAAAIGANSLICRTCSYFHDIGKLIKPEYYTENQRDGYNPHLERNPSMSALIIKSHVKEGVVLARQHKLPRIVIDVIKQHHGTTLIQYFYYKAVEKQRRETPPVHDKAPRIELDKVTEETYRYEGPKPQFAESAIIALADSVEAASRSLRKITLQSVEDLVDKIFQSRIADEQLSDSPLTLQQLDAIKRSFVFTLLNMLHARVEYPDDTKRAAASPVDRPHSAPQDQNKPPDAVETRPQADANVSRRESHEQQPVTPFGLHKQ